MCKLIIATRIKDENKKVAEILEMQRDELKTEKDGIGACAITNDGQVLTERSMSDYDGVIDWAIKQLPNAKLVALHTRTGTSGKRTIANVHFFEHEGYLLAHNGFVSQYHTSKIGVGFNFTGGYTPAWKGESYYDDSIASLEREACRGCLTSRSGLCKTHKRDQSERKALETFEIPTDKTSKDFKNCDSLQFLQNLPRPASIGTLENEIEAKGFTGMGLLIDKNTLDIHVIAKKQCFLVSDYKTFSVSTSYDPQLKYKDIKYRNVFGLPILEKSETKTISLKVKKIVEGVYKI